MQTDWQLSKFFHCQTHQMIIKYEIKSALKIRPKITNTVTLHSKIAKHLSLFPTETINSPISLHYREYISQCKHQRWTYFAVGCGEGLSDSTIAAAVASRHQVGNAAAL